MSDIGEVDLNEFQPSEAWFTRLKTFLLRDGSPLIKHTKNDPTQSEEEEESTELDFDLSESFASILEERKKSKNSIDSIKMQENKENINLETLKSPCTPKLGKKKIYMNENDNVCNRTRISHSNFDESTFIGEQSLWRHTTDESFEFLESAYSRTSSYGSDITLQSRDMNVSEIGGIKKGGNITKICLADQTQLNDIEAPSALWDSSVFQSNDKSMLMGTGQLQPPTYQTSPVKMVGLLRPSTIFEESGFDMSSAENSTNSNSTSFKTAPGIKTSDETSMSSEQFQSANESLKSEGKWKRTNDSTENVKSEDSLENTSADQKPKISLISEKQSFVRRKFYDDDLKIGLLSPYGKSSDTKSLDSLNSNRTDTIKTGSTKSILDDSLNTSQSSSCEISNDSLITDNELSSFEQKSFVVDKNLIDFNTPIKLEPTEQKSLNLLSSVIELSDDESDTNPNDNDEDLNQGFSVLENEASDNDESAVGNESDSINQDEASSVDQDESSFGDKSGLSDSTLNTSTPHEFNDTIEEMDYIMKKAVKYMGSTGTTPKLMRNNPAPPSPGGCLKNSKQRTPSPCDYPKSPITPNTVVSKRPVKKVLTPTPIKPVSKESPSQFKMPPTRIPLPKSTTSVKKQIGFQHVISPIGAYIKNTPTVPIMVSSKSRNNLLESKTVRNLEHENRSVDTVTVNSPMKAVSVSGAKSGCALPKKAYISSEYKHYVDGRTPIKIPGGDKIHKYLESAKLPTIIKHDGRVKLNDLYSTASSDRSMETMANRTVDSSIADLSIMSGEISLLTIKDAQKFGHKH